MHPEEAPVANAVDRLRATFGEPPATAIVLGSGLGSVVARLTEAREAPFGELGLPASGVHGHAGKVVRGRLSGTDVLVLAGRVHLYEGWTAGEVVRAVRALKRWGVKHLVVTCSAGGIREGILPGALVAVTDHVNLQGDNPLRGPLWPDGPRFPDVSDAYSRRLRAIVHEAARELGVSLRDGVYGAMSGPAYETPAEIRMLRTIGCDLVGMSTVPEMLAAAQVGLEATAIAVVSNRAAGLSSQPLTHDEVMDIAGRAAKQLGDVFEVAFARF